MDQFENTQKVHSKTIAKMLQCLYLHLFSQSHLCFCFGLESSTSVPRRNHYFEGTTISFHKLLTFPHDIVPRRITCQFFTKYNYYLIHCLCVCSASQEAQTDFIGVVEL